MMAGSARGRHRVAVYYIMMAVSARGRRREAAYWSYESPENEAIVFSREGNLP